MRDRVPLGQGYPTSRVGKLYLVGTSFVYITPCKTKQEGWPWGLALCLVLITADHTWKEGANFDFPLNMAASSYKPGEFSVSTNSKE